ncbi:alpha-ketoglutarate-dependent dioxygenase abh1-like isoform X2 [Phytophthora cinnamomi]|uniref:alpha-ketoglutarate-dependent dioxygenase abh1-like isoform X2 n=1 Tax=Phytophthora cinnamomi TaxID=4785 RepID=UPI0035596930|nr:alpha-ketoglutarate-dependent dioxygenase abh1-like isoform X2 [Phytophthora cinnamomi]
MSSKAERVQSKRQQHAADEHELDLFLNAPQPLPRALPPHSPSTASAAENGALRAAEANDQAPPRGSTATGALLPGLVILKGFLSPQEQQELVDDSRRMGMGEGGFYKPTYASGAKCRLHQMCLGRHWNVKTEQYEDRRSNHDDALVPALPETWKRHAQRSLEAARKIDPQVMGTCTQMTPDICVVNFYKKAGRNGMHIDKDESDEAMSMGSPVISFSIGCAAEFAYIDHYPEPHEAVPIVPVLAEDAVRQTQSDLPRVQAKRGRGLAQQASFVLHCVTSLMDCFLCVRISAFSATRWEKKRMACLQNEASGRRGQHVL